jgi:ATP-binding cassette, subfamily B, multidrug efflux pump
VPEKLRIIIPYITRYRGVFFQGIFALLVASLLSAFIPYLIKVAVDRLQGGSHHAVTGIILITALCTLTQAVLKYVARTRILNGARHVEYEIRGDFYRRIVTLPYSFFTTHHRGDLIARMMTDVGNIRMMIGMVTLHFSSTVATTILSLAMMFKLSPAITLLSIIPLCLLLLAMRGFMGRLQHIFADIQRVNGDLSKGMSEVLSGVRVIKNYLLQKGEKERFAAINNEYLKKNLIATRLWGLLFPLIGFLGGMGTLVVMWVGGYYLMTHQISLGDFIALNTYYVMLMWPIAALGWILNLYQRGTASVKRVEEILTLEPERTDGAVPVSFGGSIAFDHVTLTKDGRPILKDLTFSLREGQRLLLIGPTGSGKSSLINLLLGLEEGYSGKILLDGIDIRAIALPSLRKGLGLVPQEPFLYSRTIAGNLFSPDNPHELIALVNLTEEIARFEKGMETVVGERGVMLSGGQKQRLTLARALAKEPQLLLLDDPLTHVDSYTEHLIWQRMAPLFEGRTVIIVSSRPVPLSNVDWVIVLRDGEMADEGTADELLGRNPYMRLLYEAKG